MYANMFAKVRRFASDVLGDGDFKAAMNNRGDLCMAPALPLKTELVRLGGSYSAVIPLANHFTTVAALPTTRAEILLWNGEPGNGRSYVIDSVWFVADTTQAAATQVALLGQIVSQTGASAQVTAPTDNATIKPLINSRNGKSTYGGKGRVAIANTSFAIADKWEGLPGSGTAASASIGLYAFADLQGSHILPPGAVFCANAIVGTAAATSATMGIAWHEVLLDLG